MGRLRVRLIIERVIKLILIIIITRPTQTTIQVTKAPLKVTAQISPTTLFITAEKVTWIIRQVTVTKGALIIRKKEKVIRVHLANAWAITTKKIGIIQQMEGKFISYQFNRTCFKFSNLVPANNHRTKSKRKNYNFSNNLQNI